MKTGRTISIDYYKVFKGQKKDMYRFCSDLATQFVDYDCGRYLESSGLPETGDEATSPPLCEACDPDELEGAALSECRKKCVLED